MSHEGKPTAPNLSAMSGLRALILAGDLPPGSDHLESELATRLDMSRTPIREAALMLEAQGLVEVRPRRGIRITSYSIRDMEDIYAVLAELESLAAYSAAKAHHSEKKLVLLRSSLEEMESSLGDQDMDRWAKADADFHHELIRLADNTRIMSIVDKFNDQVRRARTLTLHVRPLPYKSNEDHRALYTAILRADKESAREIHRQHCITAGQHMIDILQNLRLKSV